jgi:carbamoyl-phosphate synthase large subunit
VHAIAFLSAAGRPAPLAMTVADLTLLAVGAALLAGALAWRFAAALAVRRSIRRTLTSRDPGVRRHGIDLATDRGLASCADALLDLARVETDPTVLATLVHAVARRQWEPASTPRIVELRLWAKAYVDSHEELRAGYESALEPPSGERQARRASDATATDLAAIGAIPEQASGDSRGPVRVLVTGAGGPAGVAVIQDLRAHGHYVVAVDADEAAVGLRLADEGHVVPRGDDPAFATEVVKVVTAASCDALLCTVAEEYAALVPAQARINAAGAKTLMPPVKAVEACVDKWAFAELAAAKHLPCPPTALASADDVPGPAWIVKPRRGRGSRDVHVVTDKRRIDRALRMTPEPIVQQRLTGREFTADALVDRDGAPVAIVPRWRVETKAGISTKGRTFDDPAVVAAVEQVLRALDMVGPANVQGFVADDGTVTIHEVNPRFSGGLPLSLHAGADLVEEYLRMTLGEQPRQERLVARADVSMYRYFAEVFEG